jgi:O-acetyl-ADP-ribose deacetylase (regulator of RNase III)
MRALRFCDVLDDPADALIYSTNVLLNCTGGVGGALLARYGSSVQVALHQWLKSCSLRYAPQGTVLDLVPEGLPYRHVLHTVPCDGFYATSPEVVSAVLRKALQGCVSDRGVKRVATSALATGYGHLAFDDFMKVAAAVITSAEFKLIPDIIVCLQDDHDFRRARELNQHLSLGLEVLGAPA